MKIYEILSEYEQFDSLLEAYSDDPEKIEEIKKQLQQLNYIRDDKVAQYGRWYKNNSRLIDSMKAEIAELQRRKKILENKTAFIKGLLQELLEDGGQYHKFDDGAVKVTWRKQDDILDYDEEKVPEDFFKVERSLKINEMKKFIKDKGKQTWGNLILNLKKNILIK